MAYKRSMAIEITTDIWKIRLEKEAFSLKKEAVTIKFWKSYYTAVQSGPNVSDLNKNHNETCGQ